MARNLVGEKIPEIRGMRWVEGTPIHLEILQGNVAVIFFFDYTNVEALKAIPYLKQWYEIYRNFEFMIVGIHSPEFAFHKNENYVAQALKRFKIDFPVVLDNSMDDFRSYERTSKPSTLVTNAHLVVTYDLTGPVNYQAVEEHIRASLEDQPGTRLPAPLGHKVKGGLCFPPKADVYAGYGMGCLGSGIKNDLPAEYKIPSERELQKPYFSGEWMINREYARSMKPTKCAPNYIALKFESFNVSGVISSENGASGKIYIFQDGNKLDDSNKGKDVEFDDEGSYVNVSIPKLYRLIDNKEYGMHELRLFPPANARIYKFSFETCPVS